MTGTGDPLVHVRNVVKVYRPHRAARRGGDLRAVDDLSFDIGPGETFGLVGESGSGKSTTSRMILRLERPSAGTITFGGRDIWAGSRQDLRRLRRDVQIVFQNPVASLNRRQTVEQIISAPLAVHGIGDRRGRRRRVRELLGLVGLDEAHAGRLPGALSGGQCQRVGIARALALRPRLVVLDEAVAAVDVSIRAQILNLLRDLQERTGVAYLFISHDLAVVRYMAPRIAVMRQGRIVEMGTREQIFEAPEHEYTRTLLAAIPEPDPRRPFPLHGKKGPDE